jgi:multidrug resistance efflux pump
MSETEAQLRPGTAAPEREPPSPPEPLARATARWRWRVLPAALTVLVAALAIMLGWALWNVYMAAPWTRDGTVRADIVTMAPEVSGRIVALPIADNQFVHKDDLLMVIDPTNYKIARGEAEAAVQQALANVQNITAQLSVQQAQISANQAQVAQVQATLDFARWQAQHYQALVKQDSASVQSAQQYTAQQRQQEAALESAQANLKLSQQQVEALNAQRTSAEASLAQAKQQLSQAEVNLERTRILSPVDGYITNLLLRLGNYVNVGVNIISVVDANSFWVDGYFEETNLAPIRVGDPAKMKLIGYRQIMRGHVDSIARAISVPNALPNNQGVATVNPIFTWVRLAQRIPVRIHIDEVPPGITLAAGMTATVQIDPRPSTR